METMAIPCGKCPACVKRRQSAWSFRLMQEEKRSKSAHFITLTYDTSKVPVTRNGFMTVNKKDVQLFMKRLRKTNMERIRYFIVAEYGGKTMRPHYHAIMFNVEDLGEVNQSWGKGSIHAGNVSGASVGYTLKYMSKKKKVPLHRNDDREREFALMSKGLGLSYLTEQIIAWHHADVNERMYCNLEDGKKITMPRYFKQKIYTDEKRKAVGWHTRKRMEEAQRKAEEEYGPNYERDKAEAIKQAFQYQERNSIKGDKL